MNRYFSVNTEKSEAPRRAYARLDHMEPPGGTTEGPTLFAYEAVDADWEEFRTGGLFPLDRPAHITWKRRGGMWSYRGTPWRTFKFDVYHRAPLCRIEVIAEGREARRLAALGTSWLEMELGPFSFTQAPTLFVYSGLFAAPVPARFVWPPRRSKQSRQLYAAFSMASHPNATPAQLRKTLAGRGAPEELAVFDVGQGSASSLLDAAGKPILYFDFGCGVHGNAPTTPTSLDFCLCGDPPIILSHWDADHWAGAVRTPEALRRTWIAPRQPLSGPHQAALAGNILSHGGRLLLIPTPRKATAPLRTFRLGAGTELTMQRGDGSDKNGSGIVVTVENRVRGRAWLLTGDADYGQIQKPTKLDLAAVVVPHHGADMRSKTPAPPPGRLDDYRRLIYSFGPDNKHGRNGISHPTLAAALRHKKAGWNHDPWMSTSPTPGTCMPYQDVRATASNASPHHDGILAGWTSAPSPRPTCPTCSVNLRLNQT